MPCTAAAPSVSAPYRSPMTATPPAGAPASASAASSRISRSVASDANRLTTPTALRPLRAPCPPELRRNGCRRLAGFKQLHNGHGTHGSLKVARRDAMIDAGSRHVGKAPRHPRRNPYVALPVGEAQLLPLAFIVGRVELVHAVPADGALGKVPRCDTSGRPRGHVA